MFSNLNNRKFIIIGATASLLLLAFYFVVLSLANSFSHAILQFNQMWYWILLLAAGFGLQAGLYFFIKEGIRSKQDKSSIVAITASGGVSAGSMVACCLHHLTDVLPLIGLTVAAVFLAQYQLLFIVIGVFSNLIGIIVMLEVIQKNKLGGELFKKILVFDMGEFKKKAIRLSFVLFFIVFLVTKNQPGNLKADVSITTQDKESQLEIIPLSNQTSDQNRISFSVTPLDFNFDNPVSFEIRINTHSVSLDFDMTEISVLEDDQGNKFLPLNWEGSSPGGHHRSGILSFPVLSSQTKEIKLTIEDFSKRIFIWKLK